jgi:hypothetical protein
LVGESVVHEQAIEESASRAYSGVEAEAIHETVFTPVQETNAEEVSPPVEASTEHSASAEAQPAQMDELVARVLEKMNPDVLQKVTRDILRPIIEAIIKDELGSKKS